MEKTTRVLAFVLAGGEGKRLAPLTTHVAKPAAPFHARHRLVDFALSNLRNSDITAVEVLLQYEPQTLLQHLRRNWGADRADSAVRVNARVGGAGTYPLYRGTADAVRCHREQIRAFAPDLVAVFSADHVYRMDVGEMVAFHLACRADVSVSAIPVPVSEAHAFGVLGVDGADRIRHFEEKPAHPAEIPGRPGLSLVSMGNYLFDPQVLLEALDATHAAGGVDFGRDLLPRLLSTHRLMAYDFGTDRLASAPQRPYWRDVGTIDAYFAAHMDMFAQAPPFYLGDPRWPIHCQQPASFPEAMPGVACDGARIGIGAELVDTVLRSGVEVGPGASLSRCIVAEDTRIGARCRLRNVIVDAGNWLPNGLEVGFDPAADAGRWPMSAGGVVVIPRGAFPAQPDRVPAAPDIRLPALPALPALAAAKAPGWEPPRFARGARSGSSSGLESIEERSDPCRTEPTTA